MVGDRHVLLDFVELARQDGVERVFLAVDGFGFQRAEQFREGHRDGVGAQRLEAVQKHVVLHHAQFDAVEVFHLGDGALAVGQVAKAVFPIHQADQALVLQLGFDFVANRAVQQDVSLAGVADEKRRVPQRHFLGDAHQCGRGADHHLLRAANQGLLHLGVGTEGRSANGTHFHLAARGFFDLFGKHFGRAALVALLVETVAKADQARFDVLRDGCKRGTEHGSSSGCHKGSTKECHGDLQ